MTTQIAHKKLEQCRSCGGRRISIVFDLGLQALAGRFPGPGEPDPPSAPLSLAKCSDCGLVQLAHNFDLDEFYRNTYGYRSGINQTMTDHLRGIVQKAEALVPLKSGDTVLDIASNDGTLLRSYGTQGLRRVGIDPTIAQYHSYYPSDVLTVADYFSADLYASVCAQPAKVITSIAVFYDLPDPRSFALDIKKVLAADGLWILEQSDLGMMLSQDSFDTICHEHLEYYSLAQISMIVESAGLSIVDIEYNGSNGGSARLFVCHAGGPFAVNEKAIVEAREKDDALELENAKTYRNFVDRANRVREQLSSSLHSLVEQGKTIHVYGASTKGNVLLQYCGIDNTLVAAASERNSSKYGHRTPGTNIPIISEADSRALNPDYLLVLPWHFRNEFIQREAAYISAGGRLIFPLPEYEVYPSP
ncbi:MAG: class I SAM-dependent methyltransferase [Alphaproteobacteria bacterium]|nr:class I SAM-dependent methyltransferase [Alphaproteobacteria bacterium]